jgi:hypothetical protein
MCLSKPKVPKVTPVASAPQAGAELISETAQTERDRERQKLRNRFGRQSTILAGAMGGGTPPTMPAKTALGS